MFEVQGKTLIAQWVQGLRKLLAALPCQCPDVLSSSRVFTERHLENWPTLLRKRRGNSVKIIAKFLSFLDVHCTIISHLVLRNNHTLSFCVRSHSVWNCDVMELSVGKTKTNKKSILVGAIQECNGNTEISTKHFLIRFQTQICPPVERLLLL